MEVAEFIENIGFLHIVRNRYHANDISSLAMLGKRQLYLEQYR
jgi:hypothetical protein